MATRMDAIQQTVADYYEVKLRDLKSHVRNTWLSLPRMVAMYLARKLTRASYRVIGQWFGGRDHSTVMKALRKVEALRVKDLSIDHDVAVITKRLRELEPA